MSKLTLHVDDDLIAVAKGEAAARHTSVSKLVSDYFRALSVKSSDGKAAELPAVTRSLVGCLKGADADLKEYMDHLEQKHS